MSEEDGAQPEGGPERDAAPPEPAEPIACAGLSAGPGQGRPFPIMRVIVGCLGLGLAVWVWFRVSYRWELVPADLAMEQEPDRSAGARWVGRYARLGGICGPEISLGPGRPERFFVVMASGDPATSEKALVLVEKGTDPAVGREVSFSGRVVLVRFLSESPRPVLDAAMARWTPPGALALALAAWSVGTGIVALVIWRRSGRS